MKTLALTLLLLGTAAASAQVQFTAPPETVYSQAQREKDEQFSRRFVQSLLQPSFSLEGQFARWKYPICPHVYGLTPAAALVLEKRIRDTATEVGAPVARKSPCTPNISFIFTAQPQASLDSINATHAFLLQGGNQAPVMTYPVQAWYTAFRIENSGFRVLDIPREVAEAWRDYIPRSHNDLPWSLANDSRLRTGQTTEIAAATILVDSKAVTGLSLAELSDYLALMALAQVPATGRCQPAPSIANLFLQDCSSDFHATRLSAADRAMLTALYQTPDAPEKLQMLRLIGNMGRNLEGENRK